MKFIKIIALLLAGLIVLTACNNSTGVTPEVEAPKLELGNVESPKGELTVSAYESMIYGEFLNEAAEKFMVKYPETKINISTLSVMPEVKIVDNDDGGAVALSAYEPDKAAEENYAKKVSTQLMSGEGADLYALDALPLLSYIERDQVENLTPYMEQDSSFNKEDYQENILERSKQDGGHYYFPLNYYFSYFTYDKNLLPAQSKAQVEKDGLSIMELLKMGITPTKEDSVYQLNYDEELLVRRLIKSEFNQLVDFKNKQAYFNEDVFLDMLRFTRQLKESDKLPINDYQSGLAVEDAQAFYEEMGKKKYLFNLEQSISLFTLLSKSSELVMFTSNSGQVGEKIDLQFAALEANASGEINGHIEEGFFMNKNSQNKELAWAFMKFLASEEMQSSPSMGFGNHAINNKARLASAEDLFTGASWRMPTEKTPELEKEIAAYSTIVEDASNKITAVTPMASRLQELVNEELANYFAEKLTAEEVAEKIQSKVTLYLNE